MSNQPDFIITFRLIFKLNIQKQKKKKKKKKKKKNTRDYVPIATVFTKSPQPLRRLLGLRSVNLLRNAPHEIPANLNVRGRTNALLRPRKRGRVEHSASGSSCERGRREGPRHRRRRPVQPELTRQDTCEGFGPA